MKITLEFDNEAEARIAMRAESLLKTLEWAHQMLGDLVLVNFPQEFNEVADKIHGIRRNMYMAIQDAHIGYLR